MLQLTLYSRQGCHLCEDMLQLLLQLQQEISFELDIRDVDTNAEWRQHYHERVPTLLAGTQLLSEYFLDLGRLRAYLNEQSGAR